MGLVYVLIIFAAFVGVNATTGYYANDAAKSSQLSVSNATADNFLKYKNAVLNYLAANPAATGAISASALSPYLQGMQASTVAAMNNLVSAVATGRQVAVYSAVGMDTVAAALTQSDNDLSIGYTAGGGWVSYRSTASAVSLPIADASLVYLVITK